MFIRKPASPSASFTCSLCVPSCWPPCTLVIWAPPRPRRPRPPPPREWIVNLCHTMRIGTHGTCMTVRCQVMGVMLMSTYVCCLEHHHHTTPTTLHVAFYGHYLIPSTVSDSGRYSASGWSSARVSHHGHATGETPTPIESGIPICLSTSRALSLPYRSLP